MCGIIGILGLSSASPRIVEALRRLEYRGYDSAGIATVLNGTLDRRRAVGKLEALEKELVTSPIKGKAGIGHTRWATHGEPVIENAHPHMTDHVALVHNGIIENFQSLKDDLLAKGVVFEGATDTEVVARLLTRHIEEGMAPKDAFKATLDKLEGAFALCVLISGEDDLMFGARRGSPLVAGIGKGENFLGSDALALAGLTNQLIYLEEGDWVVMSRDRVAVFDAAGSAVEREISLTHVTNALVSKGNHRHFMQKEIFEQPVVVSQTLGRYLDPIGTQVTLPKLPFDLKSVTKITLVACGTSYYAASVARYWIEKYARTPVEVDIASEFRYRDPIYAENGLCIFISQSGETADTLAALRHAKEAGQHTAAIVNVTESTMAREADIILPTYAGTEIGVASTKAFTCQLAVLAAFSVAMGVAKGLISSDTEKTLVKELEHLPAQMSTVLATEENIKAIAAEIADARDILFVGRGIHFPIAMEGALKLKEISYIHAEGYAAGELKHGPIALIDENVPVIGIAPSDGLLDKSVSNLQEIMARKGRVVLFSDHLKSLPQADLAGSFSMPSAGDLTSPILYALPVQLLAYYTALEKGTDVDQPRNLAKSVTVE
ncbi:glutamine--fructose-6-phosphate aminotransferase [isomerizing] [Kordiimonas sediminis]|uniref:Glutamine--fructose-6-phosphate aminotransferase [isomerizing] n=1 Tax=Kordiimonas sediminis TaxID=1735581 RepID=A0A919APD4_9PROT|nr:glutamine--fructose-6-phosphate transaminase (isomerizing) [Kordiimonas sediminis]GHF18599.1 glutamine--fructose-6-phosphate aminotransferase [isomerizing] [Kordiimonas sediminis]